MPKPTAMAIPDATPESLVSTLVWYLSSMTLDVAPAHSAQCHVLTCSAHMHIHNPLHDAATSPGIYHECTMQHSHIPSQMYHKLKFASFHPCWTSTAMPNFCKTCHCLHSCPGSKRSHSSICMSLSIISTAIGTPVGPHL